MASSKQAVSIPLDFDAALSGLLAVDPKKIAKPVKKAAGKKKAAKKATKKKPAK